ncbi:MAG: TlpA family protein disulfide reductase [Longimicrobiales bacterium]
MVKYDKRRVGVPPVQRVGVSVGVGALLRVGVGVLLVMLTGATRGAAAQDIGLPVGTLAQAVTLQDLDGNPVDLGQFIGNGPVLLEFWATWCPLCEELEPAMHAVEQRFGDAVEVVVVAVGVNQNARSIRRHLEKHRVPGRILFDAEGAATRAFKAPTTSYVVVLDAQGRVAYTGQGGDQDLVAAVARVTGQ